MCIVCKYTIKSKEETEKNPRSIHYCGSWWDCKLAWLGRASTMCIFLSLSATYLQILAWFDTHLSLKCPGWEVRMVRSRKVSNFLFCTSLSSGSCCLSEFLKKINVFHFSDLPNSLRDVHHQKRFPVCCAISRPSWLFTRGQT